MDIVNVCTAGLMLSSAALFARNAVYDYKFGKKTTAVKLSRIAVSLFGVPKREARRIIAKYQAQ